MGAALLAALALTACKSSPSTGGVTDASHPELKVAAAADLSRAFTEMGAAYEKKTGQKVVFSFGSTGLLAKQISQGAPFDVFAAANQAFVDEVVKDQACIGDTQMIYARGRIVAWVRKGTPKPATLFELHEPRFAKIAIANPEHAPYGKAAKEALTKVGAWDSVSQKAVYGENVQQTLQYAQSGNADVAIVALSLAVVAPEGDYMPIDDTLHAPLDQAMVVCHGAPEAKGALENDGRAFVAFVGSNDGRVIMRRYGFYLPGESASAIKPPSP